MTDKDCGFSVGVTAVHKHPDYKKKALFDNDFAIMILERRIECSDKVGPVCLPRFSEQLSDEHYVGFRSRVIGWGVTNLVCPFSCQLSISIMSQQLHVKRAYICVPDNRDQGQKVNGGGCHCAE